MQTNLSYILFFCCFLFVKIGFSQDIKSNEKTIIPLVKKDSISNKKKDTLPIIKKDSLVIKKVDTTAKDSLKPKEAIEDIITHTAKDYTIQDAKNKTVTLYNEANITYTDIDLKAGIIIIDYQKTHYLQKGLKTVLAMYKDLFLNKEVKSLNKIRFSIILKVNKL